MADTTTKLTVVGVAVIEDKHNDWGRSKLAIVIRLNQSERAVFQGAAGVSLGVQVAHLLDLQGALVGHRLAVPFAQNEAVLLPIEALGYRPTLLAIFQGHSTADGKSHETLFEHFTLDRGLGIALDLVLQLAEPESDQRKYSDLSSKCLG